MNGSEETRSWGGLSEKQLEALAMVAEGYTSKEAAPLIGISFRSFDKRIESACQALGVATRKEAARLYRADNPTGYQIPGEPLPVAISPNFEATRSGQEADERLVFADAMQNAPTAPWDKRPPFLVPEIRPDQLGPELRLALMIGGAIAIPAVIALTLGVANAVQDLIF